MFVEGIDPRRVEKLSTLINPFQGLKPLFDTLYLVDPLGFQLSLIPFRD